MNLVRADRSRLCIYAFVEKRKKDQESNEPIDPIAVTRGGSTFVSSISSVTIVDENARSPMKIELDLAPWKSRGYWKYHTPGVAYTIQGCMQN